MENRRLRAAFIRGGTSKAVCFNAADLPADRALRNRIFLHVMGSPDPYGRQLDGLGGGISSLSKVVIVEPSDRKGVDVDYTFVQVAVEDAVADYGSMCGNMSAAVGPFAVDEGMVPVTGDRATIRVRNTNTDKTYRATFAVRDGKAVERGDFAIPGVAGTGARITLDFEAPGGAATGKLLPAGGAVTRLAVPGLGTVEASLVDASNPVAFVRAADVGCSALAAPADLDADAALADRVERLRRSAAVAMGMVDKPEDAARSAPKIAVVAPPGDFFALDGRRYSGAEYDIAVRFVSMGKFHRAILLSGAICVAVAAGIRGTLVQDIVGKGGPFLVGNPSGVLPVDADVREADGGFEALSATTFRTQRRIMDGHVLVPAQVLTGEAAA